VRDVVVEGVNGPVVKHSAAPVSGTVCRIRYEPGLRERLAAGALAETERYQWPRSLDGLSMSVVGATGPDGPTTTVGRS